MGFKDKPEGMVLQDFFSEKDWYLMFVLHHHDVCQSTHLTLSISTGRYRFLSHKFRLLPAPTESYHLHTCFFNTIKENVLLGLLNLSTSTTTLMTRREPERSRTQTPAHWNLMVLNIIALPQTYSAVSLLVILPKITHVCASHLLCIVVFWRRKKMKIIGQARL